MKTNEELRKLEIGKLQEELLNERKSLFKIKFEVMGGHSKSNHHIPKHRKQIARIKTIIQEKQLTQEADEK